MKHKTKKLLSIFLCIFCTFLMTVGVPPSSSMADTDPPVSLPSSYDTRETTQSPVKNQARNGICWTFGALAALEANLRNDGYGDFDFSELHMAYATSNTGGNTDYGYDRNPGKGGHDVYA